MVVKQCHESWQSDFVLRSSLWDLLLEDVGAAFSSLVDASSLRDKRLRQLDQQTTLLAADDRTFAPPQLLGLLSRQKMQSLSEVPGTLVCFPRIIIGSGSQTLGGRWLRHAVRKGDSEAFAQLLLNWADLPGSLMWPPAPPQLVLSTRFVANVQEVRTALATVAAEVHSLEATMPLKLQMQRLRGATALVGDSDSLVNAMFLPRHALVMEILQYGHSHFARADRCMHSFVTERLSWNDLHYVSWAAPNASAAVLDQKELQNSIRKWKLNAREAESLANFDAPPGKQTAFAQFLSKQLVVIDTNFLLSSIEDYANQLKNVA